MQLPDELIEQGREYWDRHEQSQWDLIEWLIPVVEEVGPVYGKAKLFSSFEKFRRASNLEERHRIGKVWISYKDEYPNLSFSHLRACTVDNKPDHELATWASENEASVATIYNRKRGTDELSYCDRKTLYIIGVFEKLLEGDLPIEYAEVFGLCIRELESVMKREE